jgi:hypothetical protein
MACYEDSFCFRTVAIGTAVEQTATGLETSDNLMR